jgi:prolyl oligopeptidase
VITMQADTAPSLRNFATLLLVVSSIACARSDDNGPPPTPVHEVIDTIHGVPIADPYRWLEDQESPETRAWIDAQNRYTRRILDSLPGRRELSDRIAGLVRVDAVTEPVERNGRYFFMKRAVDQQLFVIYERDGEQGVDRKLIDPNGMSPDQTTSVALLNVSPDGGLVTYAVRLGGRDETEVRFFDVDKGRDLDYVLPAARYFGVDMLPDRSGVYYTRYDAAGPRVMYHAMNGPVAGDRGVFGERLGPEKIVYSAVTEDGRYLVLIVFHGSAGDRTEIHVRDLASGGPVRALVSDIPARFLPSFAGDRFIIQTNWKAPNGRVMAARLTDRSPDDWKEIVPESDAVIQAVSAVGGRVFVNRLENVQSKLEVFDVDGRPEGPIELPSLGSVGAVAGRWSAPDVFFTFSSFHVPPTIYRHNVGTGENTVWFAPRVPARADDLVVDQAWFDSKDGTRIPMFLVHRKDLALDGKNPTLLTGYGGFNISLTPSFTPEAVITAERGGVFALVNLRGGSEFGDAWHEAGMLDRKQNVFDDFIGAAEWLVSHRYTSPAHLGIIGGSNGGLLVGAAMTQRPDLFQAVICEFPLLDMIRYHRFMVAGFWVPEYGSSEDPAQFRTLLAYSPYQNVKPGVDYPATLLITGDGDTRVAPLHARKMAALLQARTSGSRPILLLYDTKSGHSGGAPVGKQIEDLTDALQFFFARTSR